MGIVAAKSSVSHNTFQYQSSLGAGQREECSCGAGAFRARHDTELGIEVEPYISILGISDCFRIWLVKLKVALYVVCACVCVCTYGMNCYPVILDPNPPQRYKIAKSKKAACYVTLQLKHLPFYYY